ncbi:transmembrane protein, putative (macronuclear) [Tetrahymena thermophila SB210]|uniref:Transmembrane protein, putative n=1 Tax=Tetrahymena thermophila (strain SB210) TaxID=312017 RepID=W7X4W9_TETTS|nr:transmembrane protein, putative [Tetrahymena thermophila SB210]EWS74375.1 transmembrane protein, putative [Tetrahymena thermophila SB210]|eukprot:XP_012653052.1 transmembrane protein, putative [Tetrahymena thermophila SB210]
MFVCLIVSLFVCLFLYLFIFFFLLTIISNQFYHKKIIQIFYNLKSNQQHQIYFKNRSVILFYFSIPEIALCQSEFTCFDCFISQAYIFKKAKQLAYDLFCVIRLTFQQGYHQILLQKRFSYFCFFWSLFVQVVQLKQRVQFLRIINKKID